MKRRRKLWLVLLILVPALVFVGLRLMNGAPLSLVLRYGPPPGGGPTGRVWVSSGGIEFVEISAGYFLMGTRPPGAKRDLFSRIADIFGVPVGEKVSLVHREGPPRWVEIREPFWISRTEITRGRFQGGSDDRPVSMISHAEAERFCADLTANEPGTFRLPSEAEWEYCCRAGRTDDAPIETRAPHGDLASGPGPVRAYPPNRWGLFGLPGNVKEWCADGWHSTYLGAPSHGDPWREEAVPDVHVVRDAGWFSPEDLCHPAWRDRGRPGRATGTGFRVVRIPVERP